MVHCFIFFIFPFCIFQCFFLFFNVFIFIFHFFHFSSFFIFSFSFFLCHFLSFFILFIFLSFFTFFFIFSLSFFFCHSLHFTSFFFILKSFFFVFFLFLFLSFSFYFFFLSPLRTGMSTNSGDELHPRHLHCSRDLSLHTNGHVNDLVQELDEPKRRPCTTGTSTTFKCTATAGPSQFSDVRTTPHLPLHNDRACRTPPRTAHARVGSFRSSAQVVLCVLSLLHNRSVLPSEDELNLRHDQIDLLGLHELVVEDHRDVHNQISTVFCTVVNSDYLSSTNN